jgi:quercetin dioxygenase-like cupin family protein
MALHHAAPGEKVHLASVNEVEHPKTAALVKTDAFEAAQIFLRTGEKIASHSVSGFAILQCLEGSLMLHAGEDIELKADDWVYLDRGRDHSLWALEDSSLMLTILFE